MSRVVIKLKMLSDLLLDEYPSFYF